MKEIIFNYNYKKLYNQDKAMLLNVIKVKVSQLHSDFISYDTENIYLIDAENYYLLLCFIGNKLIPFTTLRKFLIKEIYN